MESSSCYHSVASQLAEHAITTFIQKTIPPSIKKMAVQAIVDQYGLQIGGSEFEWSKSIYRYVTSYTKNKGKSSVTRYGDKLSPIQAAFIKGS